jgi:hypothetical protein
MKNELNPISQNAVFIADSASLSFKTWKYWCNKNNIKLITGEVNIDDIDKLAIVSSDVFIHWNSPNFFNLVDSIGLVRDTDDFGAIHDKIKDTELFAGDYVNCDFVVLSKENFDLIPIITLNIHKQEETFNLAIVDRVVNYLPSAYNTKDILRKDMLSHNWQLEDKATFLFRYSFIWNLKSLEKDLIDKIFNSVEGAYR